MTEDSMTPVLDQLLLLAQSAIPKSQSLGHCVLSLLFLRPARVGRRGCSFLGLAIGHGVAESLHGLEPS
jgi:hypothetical protein